MTTNRDEALRLAVAAELGTDYDGERIYTANLDALIRLITLAREPLEARVRELEAEVDKANELAKARTIGKLYQETLTRLDTAKALLREARHQIMWGDPGDVTIVANIDAFLSEQQTKGET